MKFLLALILLASGSQAMAHLLAPWVSPNFRLGEDPVELPEGNGLNQAEPHVTRSSVNPDLLLATFQEGRYSTGGGAVGNGFAVSQDGGFTWKRGLNPNLTIASGGLYYRATDPVAGIANDGTLYLNSLVSVDEAFGLGRIVLQRSFDTGETWSAPITIYSGTNEDSLNSILPDKNWMTVNDIHGSAGEGRIIVTWTDYRTIKLSGQDIDDQLIMCAYSDDLGDSWSDPVFVTPPESASYSRYRYQGSQPVFLPGGDLAVVYHNFSGNKIEVAYSPDGGRSFLFEPVSVHSGYRLYDAPNIRDGSFLPTVDVASESGDLYLAYTSRDNANDDYGYIYFVRSQRSGSIAPGGTAPIWNFTTPQNISGFLPARITCTPTICVSPDGLRVTVFFYDNRNSSLLNDSGDFYCVQSLDGGATWSLPFRLTEQTFPLNRSTWTNRGYMLGDYYGMAPPMSPDQAAVAVWIGTPLETADPWSARIADNGISVMESWIQANFPYQQRSTGAADPHSDRDRDGVPVLMEYITGQSPMAAERQVDFEDNFSIQSIHRNTDPALALDVSTGSGKWPGQWQPVSAVQVSSPSGEGYWEQLSWPSANGIEQLRFRLDSIEDWYLLDQGSPSRWVLDLGNNRVWSPWLGYIETTHAPWLYHSILGWLYDLRGALFSPSLGTYLMPLPQHFPWIYTSSGSFAYLHDSLPWLYDAGRSEWHRIEGLDP